MNNIKLSTKISLISFSAITIIMIISNLTSYYSQYKKEVNKLNTLAKNTIDRISYNLATYLWDFNYRQLEIFLNFELNDKNISSIHVKNEKDKTILFLRNSNGRIVRTSEDIYTNFSYFLKLNSTISNYNNHIGSVEITFSDKILKENLFNLLKNMIIQTLLICFFLYITIYISIKLLVINNIISLSIAVDKFSDMQFKTRILINSKDEIGKLANNFNKMAETIEKSFYTIESQNAQIKAYNENLEEIVKERTEKLRIANEILKKELQMAQKIQESLIPTVFPFSEFIEMSGIYLPMEELGGDYYDVFKISNSKMGIVIADVSGHGVPSALITAMAKVTFANNSKPEYNTAEICRLVNKEMFKLIGDIETYLTAFYCIIDIETGTLQYTSAGHQDIYILRDNRIIKLPSNSVFIGSFEDYDYIYSEIKLKMNDKIILYTDGIPELKNSNNEFFSSERFEKILIESSTLKPKEIINRITEEIQKFKNNEPPHDDITLLIAHITIEPEILILNIDQLLEYEEMHKKILTPDDQVDQYNRINDLYIESLTLYKQKRYIDAFNKVKDIAKDFSRGTDKFKVYELLGHICFNLQRYADSKLYWLEAKNYADTNKKVNIEKKLNIIEKYINLKDNK